MTALLRFQQPWSFCGEDIHATFELWNSLRTTTLQIEGQRIPLEADTSLTLALAYDDNSAYDGLLNMPRLLRGDFVTEQRGLFLMGPYSKEKIPVVFTHGLMDTPLTWLPMLNELISDPLLGEKYQFWVFFYPTVNPILQSASELRESLTTLYTLEAQRNAAWDNMVLVGHSMGGLITRLLITSSADDFDVLRQKALVASQGDPALQAYMNQLTTFTPLPFVQRAVFMGTPHRGANMASTPVGRAGSALMTRPEYMKKFLNAQEGRAKKLAKTENGIDNLKKDSPFTLALQASHWNPDIPVHSIIGDVHHADRTNGTDTVVAYTSAHLDGAESEIVVHADHLTLHKKVPAIAEVRRILIEHLNTNRPE